MKSINDKRVAYLYEAISLGTIRAAADKLNVAPSAISRQISLLEKELSTILIERSRKGVTATEAGNMLLSYYQESLSNEELCLSRLHALKGLQSGHINLAVGEGFIGDLMSGPLPAFNKLYTGLTLSITQCGTNEVIRLIEEDEAHIGLLFHPPNHPHIRSQAISQQAICVITDAKHPLTTQQHPVALKDLLQYPIALPANHFGIRQLIAQAEAKEKIRFQPALTTNSIIVLKQFVRSKMGITLLPEFVISNEIENQQLATIPVANKLLSSGMAHMVTRVGRQLPEGPQLLLRHLTTWMKAFKK